MDDLQKIWHCWRLPPRAVRLRTGWQVTPSMVTRRHSRRPLSVVMQIHGGRLTSEHRAISARSLSWVAVTIDELSSLHLLIIVIHKHTETIRLMSGCSVVDQHTGWRKKRGHRPSYLIANIPKTPWPNCMEIGGLLQYYMLNTVINFFV